MKILIIEDEIRAARQLLSALDQCEIEYELAETIDSVEDAVQWFRINSEPDLVFMDIQLADGLSFEIFQKVSIHCPIIFTTAFDQYAIKAFKFNSIDYLLKPIKVEDLQVSLDKFARQSTPSQLDNSILQSVLSMIQTEAKPQRIGILVRQGGGFVQLRITEIDYLYSEDGVTFAMASAKRYILDETLEQFMESVSPADFFRINRGQVVKKSAINRIESYTNHRLALKVESAEGAEFIVSRGKSPDFKKWMNE